MIREHLGILADRRLFRVTEQQKKPQLWEFFFFFFRDSRTFLCQRLFIRPDPEHIPENRAPPSSDALGWLLTVQSLSSFKQDVSKLPPVLIHCRTGNTGSDVTATRRGRSSEFCLPGNRAKNPRVFLQEEELQKRLKPLKTWKNFPIAFVVSDQLTTPSTPLLSPPCFHCSKTSTPAAAVAAAVTFASPAPSTLLT